ncbi:MAG: hypothetical protein K8S27_05190 [Candidatus Omnitrophica bacterium]|nr:hypothetical protein [Candidatus Omnitrophota bacterium]
MEYVCKKKKNKSGTISVPIIDKSDGYNVIKTVGSSSDEKEVGRLARKAEEIIRTSGGQLIEGK